MRKRVQNASYRPQQHNRPDKLILIRENPWEKPCDKEDDEHGKPVDTGERLQALLDALLFVCVVALLKQLSVTLFDNASVHEQKTPQATMVKPAPMATAVGKSAYLGTMGIAAKQMHDKMHSTTPVTILLVNVGVNALSSLRTTPSTP